MATVKTVKPAGGGDFTTLALWEDYADGQTSADQWAECYSGGNLGAVTLSGWLATPDASNYPKIYPRISLRARGGERRAEHPEGARTARGRSWRRSVRARIALGSLPGGALAASSEHTCGWFLELRTDSY